MLGVRGLTTSVNEIVEQIKQGAQVGDIGVVTNAMGVAGVLTITLIPTFAILISIAIVRHSIRKHKENKKIKIKRRYNSDEKLLKILNKSKYKVSCMPETLYLTFDKKGHIIEDGGYNYGN